MKNIKYTLLVTGLCLSSLVFAQKKMPVKKNNLQPAELTSVEYLPEFTREVPAESGSVFKINNRRYNLEIRVWDQPKIKILSTVPMNSDTDTLSNEELYQMSGVKLTAFGKRIDLVSSGDPADEVVEEKKDMWLQGPAATKPSKNTRKASGKEEIVVEGYKKDPNKNGKVEEVVVEEHATNPKEGNGKVEEVVMEEHATNPKEKNGEVKEVVVEGYPANMKDQTGKLKEVVVVGYLKTPESLRKDSLQKSQDADQDRKANGLPPGGSGTPARQLVEEVVVTGYQSAWTRTSSTRRNMVVFIPKNCKLVVENRFTDIVVDEDLDKAEFTLYRSNLGLRNVNELRVNASYYTLYTGNLGYGEMKLTSGTLTAGTIQNADIVSVGSEIDYDGGNTLFLKSKTDRVNVEKIASVGGITEFSELRIGRVTQDLTLEGKSSQVKIRHIAPTVTAVKISTQFADLRLPLKELKAYTIDFQGDNSTVYSVLPKKLTNEFAGVANSESMVAAGVTFGDKAPAKFHAESGEPNVRKTVLDIKCSNCTVDFK